MQAAQDLAFIIEFRNLVIQFFNAEQQLLESSSGYRLPGEPLPMSPDLAELRGKVAERMVRARRIADRYSAATILSVKPPYSLGNNLAHFHFMDVILQPLPWGVDRRRAVVDGLDAVVGAVRDARENPKDYQMLRTKRKSKPAATTKPRWMIRLSEKVGEHLVALLCSGIVLGITALLLGLKKAEIVQLVKELVAR